jgi:hypothetical protein
VFQITNSAGKPATGGFIEVYVHGTRDPYNCYADFNGTLHPFQIPLDSLGSNIILADDSQTYDVYVYNRYGGELMSRYNVVPGGGAGGAGGNAIFSSDGSIITTLTGSGWNIRARKPETLVCTASGEIPAGSFTLVPQNATESIWVDPETPGIVSAKKGTYRVTAQAEVRNDNAPLSNELLDVWLQIEKEPGNPYPDVKAYACGTIDMTVSTDRIFLACSTILEQDRDGYLCCPSALVSGDGLPRPGLSMSIWRFDVQEVI